MVDAVAAYASKIAGPGVASELLANAACQARDDIEHDRNVRALKSNRQTKPGKFNLRD